MGNAREDAESLVSDWLLQKKMHYFYSKNLDCQQLGKKMILLLDLPNRDCPLFIPD
jgi:hypothetical protein